MGGYWKNNQWINTCDWCGKECGPGDGYCSDKCRREAKEARHSKRTSISSRNDSYVDDDHSTGLLGTIWKVVKWVIIITAVWFVYDNYIK